MDSKSQNRRAASPPAPEPSDIDPVTASDAAVQDLVSRVNRLEASQHIIRSAVLANQNALLLLTNNLKLTITAVDRLAHGKSFGALGLPGEEEWNPPV